MSEPHGQPDPQRRAKLIEDLFIILCIGSLWPMILKWRHPVFEYVLYAALVGLVYVFVRRVKRFRQARDELKGS